MTNFPLPNAALENHLAVLGKTGSGKTSTSKLIVEHVVEQDYRVCILDPIKSDWWGVTSSADGKHPALPFNILGGPHGHVPLHASSGKVIGQLVGSGKLPLSIIDMADFASGDLQKFFVDFAQSLMRHAKGIVYLVVEEAHEFAPKERAGFGAENMALHYAKKLATAGRSKGIRLIVATQRVQSLHNAVLGSCETLVAHRLSTPADQEPILKWLQANTDKQMKDTVAQSLSSLPTGTAWVCSGELRIFEQVKFPKFKTYDNTATPTKDGRSNDVRVETAHVDQEQLRAIIGGAVKEAEANDPKALKAEIAKLRKEAIEAEKLRNTPQVDTKAIETAAWQNGAKAGFKDGQQKAIKHAEQFMADFVERFSPSLLQLASNYRSDVLNNQIPLAELSAVQGQVGIQKLPKPAPLAGPTVEGRSIAPNKAAPPRIDSDMPGPQRRILSSLAFWKSLGHNTPSRQQVALIAGYSPTSSSYKNPLSNLNANNHISYPSPGSLELKTDWPNSVDDPRQMFWSVLPGPQTRIVKGLLDGDCAREVLAERSDYTATSSSFKNPLSNLRSLGIIDYPAPNHVALADWAREVLA